MVRVEPDIREQIFDHAREGYPAECCGMLIGDGGGRCRVHRCDNIQDRLHARDPEAHPRTSREAYRMDDMQVHRILTEAEKAEGRLIAFYHSHIDCPAYFSEEDKAAATFFGEPTYPGVIYLVVSVVDGEVRGQRGFRWDEGQGDFAEVTLETGG